ncbi:IucA/IucC family protein [Shouchella shacheensis]|uniref:IucA/IucC family protein n=1 Tax=Shouchella shacheensis TaxID=1649580 RepID=UPI0009E7C92A|nr:IucA/IucC family protein [Shouchella shacheensis]
MTVDSRMNSKEKANHHTCKTLLNCYLREHGGWNGHIFMIDQRTKNYRIHFPACNASIYGELAYYSAMGEHEFSSYFVQGERLHYTVLLPLIIRELQETYATLSHENKEGFTHKVNNSYHKLSIFIEQADKLQFMDYITSEQSLIYGHPLHPFPKNTAGFREDEIKRFSPECRSSFQLCYVAVRSDVFLEEWLSKERISWPSDVEEQVKRKLGKQQRRYRLLPMHPWQYQHLQSIEAVQDYVQEERLILLGRFGPLAYPTSSVRTVYVPEMKCNLKLSLNMQITNMRRNNTNVQMRRTLDAVRYLWQQNCFHNEPSTSISCETGTCTCDFADERLSELFTVAYRPIHFDTSSTYVLSSIVEVAPGSRFSRLQTLIGKTPVDKWFQRYLQISLLPIVREAGMQGIHFEAHLQNSLLTIKNGMPEMFIIRDLEGVSIDVEKADKGFETSGPLFYATNDAWRRTSYYFIVNHLGSLIHAIARDAGIEEEYFWNIVAKALENELRETNNAFVLYLLSAKTFAAKKNMGSCFLGKGETPDFVPVRNLMRRKWGETHADTTLV